jgi:hypothetical protein
MKNRVPRKLKKKIPRGLYCYKAISKDGSYFNIETKNCYFYTHKKVSDLPSPLKEEYESYDCEPNEYISFCKLVKSSPMDQCKDCGINYSKFK